MLIRNLTAEHVYLACGWTDIRRSIDGLAALVLSKFQLDSHQPALFLFCGRRKDRIKGMLWDETGFLLLYKRLENGQYQWPDMPEVVHNICKSVVVTGIASPTSITLDGRKTHSGYNTKRRNNMNKYKSLQ